VTLASGAHIKLGAVEYMLDESVAKHYDHYFVDSTQERKEIVGEPWGKEALPIPGRLLWSQTDWSGGEGNNVYYEDQPSVYRVSNGMNVRKAGQATVRPKRTRATLATTDSSKQPYFCVGDGALWILQHTQGHYSTDYGVSWNTLTENNTGVTGLDSAAFVTAVAGDEAYAYYAAYKADALRSIIRHPAAAGASEVLVSSHSSAHPYSDLALYNGRLYAWTGRKLYEIDCFESVPLSATGDKYRKVFDSGVDPATTHVQGNQWNSGMVTAENALVFFYSRHLSGGTVWEYKSGVARPIWQAPLGFTIGMISYQMGVLFVAGHWGVGLVQTGTDTAAQGCGQLYAIPFDTRRVIDLGLIREFDGDTSGGLLMTKGAASYGGQVLMAGGGTGRIFVYDMKTDGLSMLDHLKTAPGGGDGLTFEVNPSERIGDTATIGPHRLATVFQPDKSDTATFQVLTWEDDSTPNRETDGQMATDASTINYLESAEYDFGFPLSPKALSGLYVGYDVEDVSTTSGLLANQRIIVQYSADAAAYATAGTITSASTPRGVKGMVFLPVSGVKLYKLRVRFYVDNNTTDGVMPPIVTGILPQAEVADWQEEWRLVVRVKDEPSSHARPRDRALTGPSIRDYLEDLFQARSDVTFLDGYRYGKQFTPGSYTTHVVHLVGYDDSIDKQGEGNCQIVLRAVAATT